MTSMQRLCHQHIPLALASVACLCSSSTVHADPPAYDYPTLARVEYVQECIGRHGGHLANLYQCSCAIDRLADQISYDDFVEASTFARYSSLPGEGGGIFRDSDQARKMAKLFRELEAEAQSSCGLRT